MPFAVRWQTCVKSIRRRRFTALKITIAALAPLHGLRNNWRIFCLGRRMSASVRMARKVSVHVSECFHHGAHSGGTVSYTHLDVYKRQIHDRAKYLREETDYCIVAKSIIGPGGMFERCGYIRSMDDFFVDLMINPEAAQHLIDEIVKSEIAQWDIFMDAVGPYVDIIQRVGDLGTQNGLIISPELYREFIKPAEQKVYDFIRSKAPHVKTWYHSCGAVSELIPDFLDFGTEILNPVQPLAKGMESSELKAKFGDRLCFHGGIDLQKAMPGTKEDVIEEVKKRISSFGKGGGYILAPANHIQNDTPPENVITLFEAAHEFGKYPLTV